MSFLAVVNTHVELERSSRRHLQSSSVYFFYFEAYNSRMKPHGTGNTCVFVCVCSAVFSGPCRQQ